MTFNVDWKERVYSEHKTPSHKLGGKMDRVHGVYRTKKENHLCTLNMAVWSTTPHNDSNYP